MSKASKKGSIPRPALLFLWPEFVPLSVRALNPIISPGGGGGEPLLRKATSLPWGVMTKSREQFTLIYKNAKQQQQLCTFCTREEKNPIHIAF